MHLCMRYVILLLLWVAADDGKGMETDNWHGVREGNKRDCNTF